MIKENNIFNLLIKNRKTSDELAEFLGLPLAEVEDYILMKKQLTWQLVYLCSKFFNVEPEEVIYASL